MLNFGGFLCVAAKMRALIVFVLLNCILSPCFSRPHQLEYNENLEEADDDDSEPDADDSVAEDEETGLNDQFSDYKQNKNPEESRSRRKIFSFRKRHEKNESPSSNDQLRSSMKVHPLDKYANIIHQTNADTDDVTDQQDSGQHSNNRNINNMNLDQNLPKNIMDKRTLNYGKAVNEEGDSLYENKDQTSNADGNGYNSNEALDTVSEQERYLKQYYNTMQAENRDMTEDKNQERAHFAVRDRRDVNEAVQVDASNNEDNTDKKSTEDDESAIKRHIKKLSSDELDQLLNSLSEDKRELLRKIISESDMTDSNNLNKREITKKAGAVEENNLVESGQSDLNKIQSDGIAAESYSETSASSNSETTETSKKPESCDISSSKPDINSGFNNKVELMKNSDNGTFKQLDGDTFASNTDSNLQVSEIATSVPKKEGKRETNVDDFQNEESAFEDSGLYRNNDLNLKDDQDYANDVDHSYSQEDNLSQLLTNDAELQDESNSPSKREAHFENESELSNSMKCLEESFPNSNAYDDSEPYSGPLVRVKRDESGNFVKKRSAALFPDAKVAFVPYEAENEDEDSNEGNEFDEDGFYDRTANLDNTQEVMEDASTNSESLKQPKRSGADDSKSAIDNPESDTTSLGSDTDSVLSGAEGVDDNLMYSSGSRNKRTVEDNSVENEATKLSSSMDNVKTPSENCVHLPNYQESDAFGPLPRNYEGDSARYKRIRRVKQSHNLDDSAIG